MELNHLDFNQFLDSVNDPKMCRSFRTFAEHCFVARPHPPILECRFIGFVIIEITQDDRRGLHKKLPWLIIVGDILSIERDNASLYRGDEAST